MALTCALGASLGTGAAAFGAADDDGVARPPGGPWLVTNVVDGDTLEVARGDVVLDVRLIGINAPEFGECWALEATLALVALVGDRPVWLTSDVSDVDQYGRALRFVADVDGNDVGATLVDDGHAIARRYPPDTLRDDEYALRQEAARLTGRGLWSPTACGTDAVLPIVATTTAVTIDIRPNAGGDDNVNLNDEWVRFTNGAAMPLDLAGWTVRDESSSHRYRFADLILAPRAAVTLFTGCGADTLTERHWCNESSAIWNNSGDTVFLLDPAGNIAASRTY